MYNKKGKIMACLGQDRSKQAVKVGKHFKRSGIG